MSDRVAVKALKTMAVVGILTGAAALSGCTALGSRAFGDGTTTGSISANRVGGGVQSMPRALHASALVPPENIGGGGGVMATGSFASSGSAPLGSVSTEDLPVLTSSTTQGNATPMSAQPAFTPVAVASRPTLGTPAAPAPTTPAPTLVSVPTDAYVHIIESGEALYTIARRYDVTAQAIIQANGFDSPDKIFVGQRLVIPGRPDLLAKKGPATPAAPTLVASTTPSGSTPIASPDLIQTDTPVAKMPVSKPLVQPAVEPTHSGAEKFRWPVSGRVITDFASSKGTGINIEATEGAAVRAAENGQVIYVGSGVEGYGNLVLIRHPNGFVSAYAHLKGTTVSKGDVVNRGDNIGAAGMTGSVSRPQLHFELRKGATPVDPVPLLAS